MKMYVANCTNQVQEFRYTVPEARDPRVQTIPIGGQIQVSGDLQPEAIDMIVKQHGIYGMYAAVSVAQTHNHIHLLYAVNKPVSTEQMRQALERNLVLMGHKGAELRQQAAVAVNNVVEEQYRPDKYRGLALEIIEDTKDGGAPAVNEELIVRRPGYSPEPPAPAKIRRGRRAA